jgi:hypothetical protein
MKTFLLAALFLNSVCLAQTSSNSLRLPMGSLTKPSIGFQGNSLTTGIYSPGTAQLGFITNGILAGFFDPSGQLTLSLRLRSEIQANQSGVNPGSGSAGEVRELFGFPSTHLATANTSTPILVSAGVSGTPYFLSTNSTPGNQPSISLDKGNWLCTGRSLVAESTSSTISNITKLEMRLDVGSSPVFSSNDTDSFVTKNLNSSNQGGTGSIVTAIMERRLLLGTNVNVKIGVMFSGLSANLSFVSTIRCTRLLEGN